MPTVQAIVLRRRDSGESDRRLTLLTREQGIIDVIAKGARKSGSRLAGSSEPLMMAELELAEGRHTRFVTQAQPITSFPGLRTDYDRLRFGLALAEIFAAVTTPGQAGEEPFELLSRSLGAIQDHPNPLVALIWAVLRLLELEGVMPSWTFCVSTGAPLAESPAWVSPHAGGYLSVGDEQGYSDRFRVDAEVLLGLSKMADLEEPPARFKHAEASFHTLFPFLENSVHATLPACREIDENLMTAASGE